MTKSREAQFVRNHTRAEIANAAHADLMIRLHCDAAAGTGFTTYYPNHPGTDGNVTGPSKDVLERTAPIAARFHAALAKSLGGVLKDNGLKGDRATAVGARQGALTGSIYSHVPVVLVEMAVLTNRKDEAFIASVAGQRRIARALADAAQSALNRQPGIIKG